MVIKLWIPCRLNCLCNMMFALQLSLNMVFVGSGRRILIFPKGNNVDHLSMYLDVADSATLPYGWSRYAQFSLAIVNQIHSKYSIRKGIFLTVLISEVSLVLFVFLLFAINGNSLSFNVSHYSCSVLVHASSFLVLFV